MLNQLVAVLAEQHLQQRARITFPAQCGLVAIGLLYIAENSYSIWVEASLTYIRINIR